MKFPCILASIATCLALRIEEKTYSSVNFCFELIWDVAIAVKIGFLKLRSINSVQLENLEILGGGDWTIFLRVY